jgi:hypothetical protein
MELIRGRFSCEDNLRRKEEINRGLLIDEYDREFMGSWPDRYLTMDPEEVAKELTRAFEPITSVIQPLYTLQERVESLYDHEREEFDAARERGYLIDHVTGNDGVLHITYMVWCALMNVPFLEISTESRAISMMFTETYKSFTSSGREEMQKVFDRYDTERASVCGNVASATGVRKEDCETLAREMLETILKPGVIDPPLDQEYSPPQGWLDEINRRIRRGWS